MDATSKPVRTHRKLKIVVIATSCTVLVVLVGLIAVVASIPRHVQDASSVPRSANGFRAAMENYLDPREARQRFDNGEAFDLQVGFSVLSEVRFLNNSEAATAYFDTPEAALAAARETHDEDSLYQNLSKPVFVFEGPPYGGNMTAIAACLATDEDDQDLLVFVFFDKQENTYSNPLNLRYLPADHGAAETPGHIMLSYASEEEKAAEAFFDYIDDDCSLFTANGKVPVYVGCTTDPDALGLTVLGRGPDETATCEHNGTVYYLWAYRTYDFNRYLLDTGFISENENTTFYLPDLARALEISVPD